MQLSIPELRSETQLSLFGASTGALPLQNILPRCSSNICSTSALVGAGASVLAIPRILSMAALMSWVGCVSA